MGPADIQAATGVAINPGESFDSYRQRVMQQQAINDMRAGAPPPSADLGPNIDPNARKPLGFTRNPDAAVLGADTNAPLPAPPPNMRDLALANQGAPVAKQVKLEGALIPPPPDTGPKPALGPGPSDAGGGGFDISKLRAIPGQTIGGHTTQAASTGQIKAIETAEKKQEDAAQHLSDAQAHTNEVAAQEGIGLAGVREGQRMEAEKREADRQRVLGQHLEQQNQMMEDIRSTKIDPNRHFGDGVLGGFKRVSAIISMVMGGIGASFKGGPNEAAQIIQNTLDRDIDAQKTDLETKKSVLGDSRALYAQKMQQFGDARAAEAASKADAYAAAEAVAQSRIANAKTDEQRANGEAIVSKLQQGRAEHDRELNKWVPPQTVGGASIKDQLDLLGKVQGLQKGEADLKKTAAETKKLEAAAAGGGPKKGLPAGVIGQISAVDSALQALDSEIALSKDKTISMADKRAASRKNLDILSLEIPHAFTGGVPTPDQVKDTRHNLPTDQGTLSLQNLDAPFTPDRMRQLESQKQQLIDKKKALLATSNIQRDVGSSELEDEK